MAFGSDPFDPFDYDSQAPHSTYPKSWAYPPLYVLRTVTRCPACGRALYVYTLGRAAYQDAEFDGEDPIEDFHFLRKISRLPRRVLAMLQRRRPGYSLDRTEPEEIPYLMNHCRCGARLDDDYVSGDIGAAFWPDTPEGYEDFKLFELPIAEPVPIESSYMLGGREFLNYDAARPLDELGRGPNA